VHDSRMIVVTGAGGFIGGRVVEILHCSDKESVRAGVRRWSSAARIGRLPVEIVQCDVTDIQQVRRAIRGATAIIHCAVGTRDVTVEGTRVMLEASMEGGVERFVHLSTVDVYGNVSGNVEETQPYQYTGREYGDAKIDAEKICWDFFRRGLPVTILRPTLVHGPFSDSWTIEFAQRLQRSPWPLPRQYCNGVCNLVYIDDLVSAIRLALTKDSAVGEAFNVNGADYLTWNDYFDRLNAAMGLPPLNVQPAGKSRRTTALISPVRSIARVGLKHFQHQIMAIYQRSDVAKRLMRVAESAIRNTPTAAEFDMCSKVVRYQHKKAEKLLGYTPHFNLDRALALTSLWLRHHGYIREG